MGHIFESNGAKLASLDVAPTAANLKGAAVYIIVDADHKRDNPNPNYVAAKDVKSSILNATGTFFSVLMAHFIYQNDRLSLNKVVGCMIGFAGVMVVNFNKELLDFNFAFLGEGFVVIAAFVLSAATIYGKKISQKMDSDHPYRLSTDHRRYCTDCRRLCYRR